MQCCPLHIYFQNLHFGCINNFSTLWTHIYFIKLHLEGMRTIEISCVTLPYELFISSLTMLQASHPICADRVAKSHTTFLLEIVVSLREHEASVADGRFVVRYLGIWVHRLVPGSVIILCPVYVIYCGAFLHYSDCLVESAAHPKSILSNLLPNLKSWIG